MMDGSLCGDALAAMVPGNAERACMLERVVEHVGIGVIVFDEHLRLRLCNGAVWRWVADGAWPGGTPLADFLPNSLVTACGRALAAPAGTEMSGIAAARGRSVLWHVRPMDAGCWLLTLAEEPHKDRSEPAERDALTGLETRRGFNDCLAATISAGSALLLLDLDRFKAVNDTLGHTAGDALLRLVGRRIAGAIRSGDKAFRLGGDEFAVLLSDPADAEALARRLIELLSRAYLVQGSAVHVGASIGIAVAPGDGLTADALVRSADLALYSAKADGRGAARFFCSEMARRAEARNVLEQDLRAAIPRGQLELFYQPQASLSTRALVGFEALLRWRHPERGMISPTEFIPLAEETRLIVQIGEWALRTACKDAARWPEPLPVAVNVSAVQLAEPAKLCRAVEMALKNSGLDPKRLELEITESALVNDPTAALEALRTLRTFGIRIAMDDFGTGYSSLSQLRSFPFDKLKIDRSFVRDLGDSEEAIAVVRAIAALGASLGMRTTAEGVETGEQADRVQAEGCTDMQGYLLSRPQPATEISDLINRFKQQP